MTLSPAQKRLLARINRCPKGCFLERSEKRTAEKLKEAGMIDLNASSTIAWPKEGK